MLLCCELSICRNRFLISLLLTTHTFCPYILLVFGRVDRLSCSSFVVKSFRTFEVNDTFAFAAPSHTVVKVEAQYLFVLYVWLYELYHYELRVSSWLVNLILYMFHWHVTVLWTWKLSVEIRVLRNVIVHDTAVVADTLNCQRDWSTSEKQKVRTIKTFQSV